MLQATIMICKVVWSDRVGVRELTAYEEAALQNKQTKTIIGKNT